MSPPYSSTLTDSDIVHAMKELLLRSPTPSPAAPPSAPLCVDCKWSQHYQGGAYCGQATVVRYFDPVTGTNTPQCLAARQPGSPCGQGGTCWEQR